MDREFVYNPDKPCVVFRNGEDIGALVAGQLYLFDSNLKCVEACILVENLFFQFGEKIGRLEGEKIFLESYNEVLELLEK